MTLLSGIRVLDLSLQLPGPFCTMMMADYGADVVKIDEPSPRVRNPFAAEEPGTGPVDRYLNRGKRSVTLNLKAGEGKEIFRKLAAGADVVLEGFRPGVVKRLGVDPETLRAENPRLVYCSISGYGQTGPMRDTAGHDINYISYAGVLGACGRKGDPPTLPPVQIGDLFGGAMMALSGILMALLEREKTGKGRRIDVSMTDGALSMLSLHAAAALAGEIVPERGNMMLTGMFPCYEVYRCADGGYVSVGPLEAWFWKGFVEALERPDLADGQYALGEEGERVTSVRREDAGRVGARVRGKGRLPVAGVVDRRSPLPPEHGCAEDGPAGGIPAGGNRPSARDADQDRRGPGGASSGPAPWRTRRRNPRRARVHDGADRRPAREGRDPEAVRSRGASVARQRGKEGNVMTDSEILSVLRPDGTVDPLLDPGLPDPELLSLYR
ncbi:MAG: cbiB, partial [Actinobacteria bacterium]|nr:cbiB [Actinomycetota bacterium]